MKYKVLLNHTIHEGLYPVYAPFCEEVKALGGEIINSILILPDTVMIDDITAVVKKYREYIKLVPYE